jgi:hypothetical protein
LAGFFVLHEPPPPFNPTYEVATRSGPLGGMSPRFAQPTPIAAWRERQFEACNRLTAFMAKPADLVAQLIFSSNAQRHKPIRN